MLGYNDISLKQTQFYREVFAEGEQEGEQKGILKGMQKGMLKGEEKMKLEVARRLLKKGMSVAEVAEITGISAEILSVLCDSEIESA